jgi:hypothetical protein
MEHKTVLFDEEIDLEWEFAVVPVPNAIPYSMDMETNETETMSFEELEKHLDAIAQLEACVADL